LRFFDFKNILKMTPRAKKESGMDIEKPRRKRVTSNRIVSKNGFRRLVKLAGLKGISKDLMEQMPRIVESLLLKALKDYVDANTSH
jgi:hypothetical protein